VIDVLARMRVLASESRTRVEALSVELRQAERQFDELSFRLQTMQQLNVGGKSLLQRQHTELRSRCDALQRELHAQQHAVKQLDQLVRQIEMSSSSLTGSDEASTADPWMLALRSQIIHGREQERQRLAREIHDGPAQVLANALMMLETCYGIAQQIEHPKLETMLDRMRTVTREGLGDVRRFIADLRPGKLDEQGLNSAITELVQRYSTTYGAKITLEADRLPRLAHDAEIVLYRVAQEALQNAYKYARGASVTIRVLLESEVVSLTVRDEGPGFDPREVARRAGRTNWGLTSMRERAELIGASFKVTSRPGHGTEVLVRLPIT
jgi:two-component system sensor histidine kinase DegS